MEKIRPSLNPPEKYSDGSYSLTDGYEFVDDEIDPVEEFGAHTPEQKRDLRKVLALVAGLTFTPVKDSGQAPDAEPLVLDAQHNTTETYAADSGFDSERYANWAEVDGGSVAGVLEQKVLEGVEKLSPVDVEQTLRNATELEIDGVPLIDYLRDKVTFAWNEETQEGIPPRAQAKLRELLIGMCAKESRFDPSRRNGEYAGLLQVSEKLLESYGSDPKKYQDPAEQIRVAALHLEEKYDQLISHLESQGTMDLLRQHGVEEQTLQDEILPRLAADSHHAGAGRLAEAVKYYFKQVPADQIPRGRDLVPAIIDFARASDAGDYLSGYGAVSAKYLVEGEAWTLALEQLRSQRG
ncbi:hypothetical protein H6786_02425 [Candidatus Nomurabacteria bacterium]|nr:hypothetical protein [Candidatus Nomurabacteria bacterium]